MHQKEASSVEMYLFTYAYGNCDKGLLLGTSRKYAHCSNSVPMILAGGSPNLMGRQIIVLRISLLWSIIVSRIIHTNCFDA